MVPPPSQNTVGVCNQITLLIHYYFSSRLVNLLQYNDALIQVSDVSHLTLGYKYINFSLYIFLFVPETSAIFTS